MSNFQHPLSNFIVTAPYHRHSRCGVSDNTILTKVYAASNPPSIGDIALTPCSLTMNSVEESIRIERPVKVVYDQWTQFEDFPHFMEGVKEVRQIDDSHLHWEVEMGGFIKTWEAEIIEQVPDQFIAWQSTEGPRSTGRVTFESLADDATMVTLRMAYAPEGVVENLGALLGLVSLRIARDLQCFKDFIEARGTPPKAWRGEIHAPEIIPHATVASVSPRSPGAEKMPVTSVVR